VARRASSAICGTRSATRQRLRGSLDLDLTKAPLAEIVARLPEHRPA
jgi:hypothetical protein